MPNLHELTAQEAIQKITKNELSVEEYIQAIFEKIHNIEGKINREV